MRLKKLALGTITGILLAYAGNLSINLVLSLHQEYKIRTSAELHQDKKYLSEINILADQINSITGRDEKDKNLEKKLILEMKLLIEKANENVLRLLPLYEEADKYLTRAIVPWSYFKDVEFFKRKPSYITRYEKI
ncbi:hypothetical protein HYX19_05275 [Candidatus Woesearchaeota archaeon]|nr:hypothetical protein [Candidatus Woesearchaeota archaeon]